jgi:small-conductance mechanosensitive channel
MHSIKRITVLLIFISLINSVPQSQKDNKHLMEHKGSPVTFKQDTLFYIYGNLGPFSADFRAKEASEKIKNLINDNSTVVDSIKVLKRGSFFNVQYKSLIIVTVSEQDTIITGTSKKELANLYLSKIKKEYGNIYQTFNLKNILFKIGLSLIVLLFVGFLFFILKKLFAKIYNNIEKWEGTKIRPLIIKSFELLSAESLTMFFLAFAKLIRLGISLIIIYYALINILEQLPWTKDWNIEYIVYGIFWTILFTAIFIGLFKGKSILYKLGLRKIVEWKGSVIKGVSIKNAQVLSEERMAGLIALSLRILNFTLLIILFYFYITIIFSFFTITRTWSKTLINYILNPLNSLLNAIIGYLPNLFFIIIIIFFTRYLIKIVKFIFSEMDKGTISFPGFQKDWAVPTFKIVRFIILVLSVIIIYPYLPGAQSRAFEGVSILLGVVLSMASASAISNMIAGIVLTYMSAFKLGDRVKIADTIGDVIEKTLLVTRVRTIKNVDVTIPNSMVLGSHIINFSSSAQERGLILHTSVTISYDAPWKKVHELLINAALECDDILKEPKPFVLQNSLNDFYVNYEINAYTNEPGNMAAIYSQMHSKIQDKFNEAGVEIMSPHFSAVRDGNQTAIPQDYLPKDYQPRSFRIFPFWGRREDK